MQLERQDKIYRQNGRKQIENNKINYKKTKKKFTFKYHNGGNEEEIKLKVKNNKLIEKKNALKNKCFRILVYILRFFIVLIFVFIIFLVSHVNTLLPNRCILLASYMGLLQKRSFIIFYVPFFVFVYHFS